MNIKFNVRGVKEVQAMLSKLPRGVKIAAMRAFNEYIIGDENHGLKHEPARVMHGPGNPYIWQSEKQRKAFFATDGFGGGIPTERTHEGVNSWTMTEVDSNWTMVKIEGGNAFVQGDWQQKGHAADGWRKYGDILKTNMAGAMQKARDAVKAYLQSRK
jgi:hypothetical protein